MLFVFCLDYLTCKSNPFDAILCSIIYGFSGSAVIFEIVSQAARFSENAFYVKCAFLFFLQLLSETFFILGRIQRDNIINVPRPSRKAPDSFN